MTISTTGNAADFGDVLIGSSNSHNFYGSACNNATRAVFLGSATSNTMEYVTMATTGNASDFGDQTSTTDNTFAACTSGAAS